ncbi:hypothetical protein GOZ90_09680 [Agrobacterium vitis]|uniref:Uncharacterized protein n=1 Tax=Agrobacterium vitis TaxID=373 RepID=A0A6L6VHQ5_AGRVI|nr:hypothetical protein [Agrobacterium vitis]MUZ72952.1 hypothetical protein [Agrobacterium vitis]
MSAGKVISIREETPAHRSLDDRIADVFVTNPTSDALTALLREVKEANTAAQMDSNEAEARALDPKLRPAEVDDARAKMQDADFRGKRMDAAAAQLQTLLDETKREEEAEGRRRAHAAAIAERDQLVKDLAAYEEHAKAIVGLLERVAASNAKLHMDEHAERIARGADLAWNVRHDERLPMLVTTTRLPKYRMDGSISGFMWPPQA